MDAFTSAGRQSKGLFPDGKSLRVCFGSLGCGKRGARWSGMDDWESSWVFYDGEDLVQCACIRMGDMESRLLVGMIGI